MDAVRVCLLIVAELVFIGKEDRNCIPKHIVSLVEDFDSWNDYPWGLVDEDFNVSQHDGVSVVSGNCVDLQNNFVLAVSVLSANSHEGLNESKVANNDILLLKGGDADVLDEVRALRKEVSLVKFDDARISKLERLLNDNFMFRNDISPNGNHNAVNQGLSSSANHPMSTCPDIDNAEVAGHVIEIHKSTCSGADILDGEVAGALNGIHKADGNNDTPNVNHNAVNKGLSCSANDRMSTCSSPDMDNGEVAVAVMGIHKADGQNDIPNANDNVVNQGIISLANDPMLSTLDVLVQGFNSQKNHRGIDVIQHDTHVDCFVAKMNDYPTTDIGVKVVPVDEFADDFMDVLNDEESITNYSLDDMKLQDEEEKLISTPTPLNHQQVDELIDVHEDKTTVLQENVKTFEYEDLSNKSQYVNVVKEDYKPCLGMVFSNVKAKRKKYGIERNYVLRSVKERKKRLAMSLDSPFAQQETITPTPPKTISRSVNEAFIEPPEFLEDASGEPKMRSINELMTLEVFVKQLSRPHNCIRDKVTLPDGFFDFIKMQDPPKYRFPWGYRDIVVDREFWYPVAWRDVEKVYFLETMVANDEENIATTDYLYLNDHGVLQSKGITIKTYEIKYMFPKVVRQEDDYGDCGVWLLLVVIVITTGSILVTPGSVITTGSILVTPGSVITTGSILVTPGSVLVTPGSYSLFSNSVRDPKLDRNGRKSTRIRSDAVY
ncbi:hypothetical protein Tco_0529657 [Tanacetum coccineum]